MAEGTFIRSPSPSEVDETPLPGEFFRRIQRLLLLFTSFRSLFNMRFRIPELLIEA
jgi:hypothetical protein